MTSQSSTFSIPLYAVLAGVGTLVFAGMLERLVGAQSMAALVAVRLGGAGLAIGLIYLVAPHAHKAETIAPVSKGATLTIGIAGLIVLVTITIWSREWWLAVEVLVIFVILLVGLLWWTLKLRDRASHRMKGESSGT